MNTLLTKTFLLAITASLALTACADTPAGNIPPVHATGWTSSKKTMRPFRSEQELKQYLKELAAKQRAVFSRGTMAGAEGVANKSAEPATRTIPETSDESITNVQHAGVDEGGIVKLHGPYLVVLRRGRLFTVKIADDRLQPVSSVDAFGPDIDPKHAWYDEMLVSGNTIVVIGYSYERGGTEIGLFGIDDGRLSYRSTHHLRSNDYYSSRNYASRLIDNKLIFYTPLYLNLSSSDPFQSFPAVRKWHNGATQGEFQMIAPPTRIYRSEKSADFGFATALHTVTVCDLAASNFKCEATGVIGPSGRVFYVSPSSVYVWATAWHFEGPNIRRQSFVFRMPLDGSSPSALGVSGSPVDQFSFLESEDGHLNVLVRSEAAGDGMWRAEVAHGDVALMRVPLWSFSDGSENVAASSYRALPKPQGYTFQNRFVGEYLLYGTGSSWGYPGQKIQPKLYTVRWADGTARELDFAHGVDRIEQLGSNAIVIGADENDLHFTAVRLGVSPEVADRFTRKSAAQGELRSHGFFYRADGPDSGTLGLPISRPGRPGFEHLFEDSAAILFLRNQSLRFQEAGELAAQPERATNDSCRASCVDWYGNARPLFISGRIFALLGYEIVEGAMSDGRIRELRRVSYAPGRAQIIRQSE